MEERDPKNRANFLLEIECDSVRPSVYSRKDTYLTGPKIAYHSSMYRKKKPGILSQRRSRGDSSRNILCHAEELQKVIKTDDVYKIETILKKRKKGRRVQYLVKWLGYPESFNSWIFKQDLQKRGVAV